MLPIASIIRRSSGSTEFQNGTLFPLPPELTHKQRMKPQMEINQAGWHRVDFGYHAFAYRFRASDLLIFPWLIVEDEPKPSKKYPKYKQSFTRRQIENFAESFALYTERETQAAQEDLNLLIHDLRGLSTTIQHQGHLAKNSLEKNDTYRAKDAIESILATQSLLSLRTDALDFLGNPNSILEVTSIAFYRKIDRVVRSYRPRSISEHKTIELIGNSFGQIYGPNVFELIPFSIIDNAIKYSPKYHDIQIEIGETGGKAWFVCSSLGPLVRPEEMEMIFERGKRGEAAILMGKPGSGVGLNLIQRLVLDQFSGTITVSQDPSPKEVSGNQYYLTRFRVSIPLHTTDSK